MSRLPRIAVGGVYPYVQWQSAVWALTECLQREVGHVQSFASQSRFFPWDAAGAITGQGVRHLDSWTMSPKICRELFLHGMYATDLGVVEGPYVARHALGGTAGGRMETLCEWLDLPRVVIMDVSHSDACRIPDRPRQVDAIILDRLQRPSDFLAFQTRMEALWRAPVVGAVPVSPALSAVVEHLPDGTRPSRELCRALGNALSPYLNVDALLRLADRRPFADRGGESLDLASATTSLSLAVAKSVTVAVPYDDAFYRYFPDTLDLLEARGARIRHFSPLRDESLPPDTDLVFMGCGRPELFADRLAGNHCMLTSLREYIAAGGRVYAEGGAAAYLCRRMVLECGRQLPMVGALPVSAHAAAPPDGCQPMEFTMPTDNWLAPPNSSWRGYRNPAWSFSSRDSSVTDQCGPNHQLLSLSSHNVVASLVHINFAAYADAAWNLLQPGRAVARATAS